MVRPAARQSWLLALVAVLLAVFVAAPAVEAAVCGTEPPTAYAPLDCQTDDGSDLSDDAGADHGLCAHGHCHHPSPLRVVESDAAKGLSEARATHALAAGPALACAPPHGLKRPPRA